MKTLLFWVLFYSFFAAVLAVPVRFLLLAYGIYGVLLWALIIVASAYAVINLTVGWLIP